MYFDTKSYLKNNRNHTAKHARTCEATKFNNCGGSTLLILGRTFNQIKHRLLTIMFS